MFESHTPPEGIDGTYLGMLNEATRREESESDRESDISFDLPPASTEIAQLWIPEQIEIAGASQSTPIQAVATPDSWL